MDKKSIISLLVKGNKAKHLVNRGVKVPTKLYRPTKNASIVSGVDIINEQSIGQSSDVLLDSDRIFTPPVHIEETVSEYDSIHNGHGIGGGPLENSRVGIVDTDTNTYCPESDRQIQVQVDDDEL